MLRAWLVAIAVIAGSCDDRPRVAPRPPTAPAPVPPALAPAAPAAPLARAALTLEEARGVDLRESAIELQLQLALLEHRRKPLSNVAYANVVSLDDLVATSKRLETEPALAAQLRSAIELWKTTNENGPERAALVASARRVVAANPWTPITLLEHAIYACRDRALANLAPVEEIAYECADAIITADRARAFPMTSYAVKQLRMWMLTIVGGLLDTRDEQIGTTHLYLLYVTRAYRELWTPVAEKP